MQELKTFKKININLDEFDSPLDVHSRILLASFDSNDVAILEELLYSPLKTSIEKVASSIDMDIEDAKKRLEKMASFKLFILEENSVSIQKERRKYFETAIEKFDSDFCPGVNYIQSYLKCLPIHLFQPWYHIPRSSNNIFDSIVEKYLLTPQTYKRYLYEATSDDSLVAKIATDVLGSSRLEIPAETLKKQYNISNEDFQKIVIELELSLLCVSYYRPSENGFIEVLAALYEWSEYLRSTSEALPAPIEDIKSIQGNFEEEYPFISDMSTLLDSFFQNPIDVRFNQSLDSWTPTDDAESLLKDTLFLYQSNSLYIARLIHKLLLLGLVIIEDNSLVPAKPAKDWLKHPIEKRTHITFKHPHNALSFIKQHEVEASNRTILEIQKSLSRVKKAGWIFFEDFLQSAVIPLHEKQGIELKRMAGRWRYDLPTYSSTERAFLKRAVLEWLYESGMVLVGKYQGKDCFTLTKLGEKLFL